MNENVDNFFAEAMFISDLHLHPEIPEITEKFFAFLQWAATRTKTLYILGDFFHAWPGDDAIDNWSDKIIKALADLSTHGIEVYFMPGNRDFLVGKSFLTRAKLRKLSDPAVINLSDEQVLLTHGDRYCTKDRAHQNFRRLTRNSLFKLFFLRTPYAFRRKIVDKVRNYSQFNRVKPIQNMQVVPATMIKDLRRFKLNKVIHGHTHIPGLVKHAMSCLDFYQYVLSDWDENPAVMCYNKTNKFYYVRFAEDLWRKTKMEI